MTYKSPIRSIDYRPEIDGLRAIAVLIIILYHAKIFIFGRDWFEGGYIGVDIFFVISGYLITRIILKEILKKGLKTLLFAIYNSSNQRSYLTVKLK